MLAGLGLGPVGGLAADSEVTRRMLRLPLGGGEELVVANAAGHDTAGQWFLRRADGRLHDLGEGLAAMHEVDSLLPSPDGMLLAVLSVGEGHPFLEVVDLHALRAQGDYLVVRDVDPYPGSIEISRWSDGDLVVGSDIALTYAGEDGRVSSSLLLAEREEFKLLRGSWEVEAVTFSAAELGDHQLAKLASGESWEREEAARALAALAEPRFVPALEGRLRRERDREVRRTLRQALAALRRSL
jgi:hypothetical protein